ncbi:hypothetical protein D0C16_13925 [Cellvibrio sp. KY-GH-1]|uniref:hypothetical protein n=1 Tax=Cellvibrio sp. KY-GH-1 TaxID=2303332 RepID=UPI001246070E|nr:hypothetical protein [Cellvibrio sp. KY-GH-1]QEY16975.1 hypothetical protein D0C16_13925 [Cellvibrio sp. KY-GH-1]
MRENNHQITADDAKAALASIGVANKITLSSMRPPLWLILLCAIALGIKTAAMGSMINNSLWNAIHWGAYSVICLSVVSWIIALRINGITIKISDVNITVKGIVVALLICALLILSRVIYLQSGSLVIPCVAGVLNALILTIGLRFGRLLNAKKGNSTEARNG